MRLARLARAGDEKARKRLVEYNAGLAYNNATRYASMNKGRPHMDDNDLLQAAFVGLTEASHTFDPERGHKFVTHAHWWVNKRISEEIARQHWTAVRPPEATVRSYLFRHMDEDEQEGYEISFMRTTNVTEDNAGEATDDAVIMAAEVMEAVGNAGLSMEEELTFLWLHDPETPPFSLRNVAESLGITIKQAQEYELSAIDKIRLCLGIQ